MVTREPGALCAHLACTEMKKYEVQVLELRLIMLPYKVIETPGVFGSCLRDNELDLC